MTAEDAAERVAENAWLKLLGRFAMVAAFPLLGYVGTVAASVSDKIDAQQDDIAGLRSRVVVLENNTARGREDRLEFQRQTTQILRELQAGQAEMTRQIAALNATLEAQQRQMDRKR